jgi:ankyrin repeat protein
MPDLDELGIEFSHFSVQEYLQGECLKNPTLSAYGVSRQKACNLLASLCLQYLTLKNYEQLLKAINDSADEAIDDDTDESIYNAKDKAIDAMNERDFRHPFYRHAATLWPFYVSEGGQGCCLERIHDLFQLPKTPSFCVWATTLAAHSMSMNRQEWYTNDNLWFETPSFSGTEMFFDPFHVVRPGFTPLHMAAVLGMPALCDHLLKQGANVNARGKFGTPLHCAIAGLGIFTFGRPYYGLDDLSPLSEANLCEEVGQLLGRQQTGQFLLKAEANPNLRFISDQEESYSSLSLAAMCLSDNNGLELAVELIKVPIAVGEEELRHFHERYDDLGVIASYDGEYGEGQAVVDLLEALGPPDQETKGTPRSRLYTETYNWATLMRIEELDQLSTCQPTVGFTDDEMIELITGWIYRNNALGLNQFLESNQAELILSTKFGPYLGWPEGTALHLATLSGSLDVLDLLLQHGLDADVAERNGRTPVHLCFDEAALRVLLQHGASTLVPDKSQETVWHVAARKANIKILNVLVGLDVRQQALQIVSSINETPICSALNNGRTEAVLLLLKHCGSGAFWKSGKSIFRAAAETGSSEVIQHLLDVGIEVDGMDGIAGSPLHFLSTKATVECIQILKGLFPLDQRRKQDLRTPLESLLLRAVETGGIFDRERLQVMLPDATVSNSKEASSLWSFLGLEVTRRVKDCRNSDTWTWFKEMVSAIITLEIMAKYEEEREESALLPFMSAVTWTATSMYKTVLKVSEQPKLDPCWGSISDMMRHGMGKTRHWDSAVGKPDAVRLLSLAILHDDAEMVSLLISKGVDMHSRADELSPFEFACFPNVPVSERGFALLLKHTSPEKISQGNESLLGCGPLHFVAGGKGEEYCAWKLKQMLETGVDPNLPLPAKSVSPLVFHIRKGAISTAEMLLEAGADPWARGSGPFDAALEAVRLGRLSILTKIVAISGQSPCWDRTWVGISNTKKFASGNALHLAALRGNTKCLEFYLDRGLLSDLECRDDDLKTPMHYAARYGHSSTIVFFKARGGNINARNRNGLTPLHLAADRGHLETVKTLINLSAKHQSCNRGCTPLVYAYAKGNESMIEALQSSSEEPQESSSSVKSPETLRLLAEAMRDAILRSDVAACERIHALGCPIDVDLYDGVPVTPLAMAICHEQDPKIVQWLVDSGATVSAIFPQPYQDRYLTALEAAVAQPMFNSLLHKLLNSFLEEGGNFLDMGRSPLHFAVGCNNTEGLKILVDWLRNTYGSSELNLYVVKQLQD